MNDLIIVKCNVHLPWVQQNELRARIMADRVEGVVVLPPYCDVILAPKDVEIVVKDSYDP